MPTIVTICIQPAAMPSRREPASSLRMPIFAGLKNVDWAASRKNAPSASRMDVSPSSDSKQAPASSRINAWATSMAISTVRFEQRSANQPATGANSTKGSRIIAPSQAPISCPRAPAETFGASPTSIIFRMLSLKAFSPVTASTRTSDSRFLPGRT